MVIKVNRQPIYNCCIILLIYKISTQYLVYVHLSLFLRIQLKIMSFNYLSSMGDNMLTVYIVFTLYSNQQS